VLRLFATVDRESGPLRALIDNAGTTAREASVADIEMATLRKILDINVTGYFLCARR
jgi:NAD(P)-dependent dehydrogenase (short-subunit alcohol dehydrogenase family)